MKKLFLALAVFTVMTVHAQSKESNEAKDIYIEAIELIVQRAKEKYPDNYTMQEWKIKSETESLNQILKLEGEIKKQKEIINGL